MWQKKIAAWWKDESAPTFLEYALLIIVIALVVVGAAAALGQALLPMFSAAGNPPGN